MQAVRNLPQLLAALSYYDTRDGSLLADDGHAVLANVVLQNPDDHIDIGQFVESIRQASNDAAGFEIGVVSFRILEDELDEILTEDFNRILIY